MDFQIGKNEFFNLNPAHFGPIFFQLKQILALSDNESIVDSMHGDVQMLRLQLPVNTFHDISQNIWSIRY